MVSVIFRPAFGCRERRRGTIGDAGRYRRPADRDDRGLLSLTAGAFVRRPFHPERSMPSKSVPPRRPSFVKLEVPLDFEEVAAIDGYIAEIDSGMSRPDAIREILRKALAPARPSMAKVSVVDRHAEKPGLPKPNASEQ